MARVFRFHAGQIASAGPRRGESPELVSARIKHAFRNPDTARDSLKRNSIATGM